MESLRQSNKTLQVNLTTLRDSVKKDRQGTTYNHTYMHIILHMIYLYINRSTTIMIIVVLVLSTTLAPIKL